VIHSFAQGCFIFTFAFCLLIPLALSSSMLASRQMSSLVQEKQSL